MSFAVGHASSGLTGARSEHAPAMQAVDDNKGGVKWAQS
jgi:hypothetical protein